jgi:MFS transporter, PHS family, inorganic phosphate transporter
MGDLAQDFAWEDTNRNHQVESESFFNGENMNKDRVAFKKSLSNYITSISNFSVQYNIQAMALALIIMSKSVCTSNDDNCRSGDQDGWVVSTSQVAIFIGAISGQLSMGYLGDIIGRSAALKITLMFVLVGAIGSAFLSFGSASAIYAIIISFRFILGVGVGGVYPLSATKAAEDSSDEIGNNKNEVNSVASAKVFFWQAPGQMAPSLLGLCLAYSDISPEAKWRLILGLGAIPAAMVIAGTMIEEQYTKESTSSNAHEDKQSPLPSQPKMTLTDVFTDPSMKTKMIVSGGGWFLYDVCFYGMELFSPYVLDEIDGDDDNVSSKSSIYNKSWRNTIALGLGIPAVIYTIYLMEQGYSLRKIQVWGFIVIAVAFLLLACLWTVLDDNTLYGFYCFLLCVLSFGPNVTTFTLPATMYPKEIRATMNGISAAFGKLGAVFGVYLFNMMSLVVPVQVIMILSAGIAFGGAYVTYIYLPEPPVEEEKTNLSNPITNPINGRES